MRDLFSSLYALAANKDACIANYCEQASSSCIWSLVFICDAFSDDVALPFVNFLNKLNGLVLGNLLLIQVDGVLTVKGFHS